MIYIQIKINESKNELCTDRHFGALMLALFVRLYLLFHTNHGTQICLCHITFYSGKEKSCMYIFYFSKCIGGKERFLCMLWKVVEL